MLFTHFSSSVVNLANFKMNSQPRSFMLLPDWSYKPEDVRLGTLLYLSSETKLPDPDVPANKGAIVEPDASDVKALVESPFAFTYDKGHTRELGFDAELPVFSPVSGGIGYNRHKSDKFAITCATLETARFAPSSSYLARSLQNEKITEYCKQHHRPSVYLVTGVKVASKAMIKQDHGQGFGGKLSGQVDTTATGLPLNVGPTLESDYSKHNERESAIEGPFVLAYQLKRVRMKRDGSVKDSEGYTKHALFNDVEVAGDTLEVAPLEDMWEVEDVVEGNERG